MLFTDASFANCDDLKSQIGFVLVLADKKNNANIVHFGSSRCKRVTRSVMAAEVHGLVYGFDSAFIEKNIIEELLGTSIPMDVYVDSKTLFNIVAKDGNTAEKRLKIDMWAIRESYDKKEIRNIYWIASSMNLADQLTKPILLNDTALWNVMKTNKINTEALGWTNSHNTEKAGVSNHKGNHPQLITLQ